MSSLSIGLSGLLVNQRMIDLTGHNITNADTPGYHRQVAELAARIDGSSTGAGVVLKSITRVINNLLEYAIVRNTSSQSNSAAQLDVLNQLQSFLAPGDGTLHDTLVQFFDAAERLSTQPDDLTMRRVFLFAANALADRLDATAGNLSQMRRDLTDQATASVNEVNALTAQIAQLNQEIHDASAAGQAPNALMDRRDTAIAKLSELIDLRTVPQEFGEVNVLAGGTPLVLNSRAMAMKLDSSDPNQLFLHVANSAQTIEITGGKLAGLLSLNNVTMRQVRTQFDAFAEALITGLDHVQAGGLGLDGPLTSLSSERLVTSTTLPLAAAKLSFPPIAGDLHITVTDLATGQRSMHRLNIDPATQSLADVAAAISTIPNLQAVVDPQAGTLNFIARPGYGFDFTGNFSSTPDAQSITGTTAPTFAGAYTGGASDTLEFQFVGSGTIGSTLGLGLEVRNGAGTLLASLDLGPGYEAGTDLPGVLGVKAKLSSGTVVGGESFSLRVAADADTSGLLPALGLHSFFVGNGAAGLRVNPALLAHPESLALSRTEQPGDGTNLAKLIALRDDRVLNGQTQSFQQFLEDIIGGVGAQTKDMETRKTAYDALGQQLELQRQSDSGVDPNEELMKLVQYQRSYQYSAHFIAVVNQTLDEVLKLVGN